MTDDLTTINRQASLQAIKLPEEAVKGLMPIQIQAMKETAVDVNSNMSTAGKAIAESARMLYELKANLKYGNWGAFIKSNALSISERAAIDLVSTYENWLSKEEVREDILATMTPRTLSVLASATPDKRNQVLAKIIGAETKPTEMVVRQLIKGIAPKKKGETIREKLTEAGGKLVMENQSLKKTSVEQLVALSEENEKLREENKLLKARVKELEGQLKAVS
jgi:ethanolamine utilization protein EutP (predicted NTPase)